MSSSERSRSDSSSYIGDEDEEQEEEEDEYEESVEGKGEETDSEENEEYEEENENDSNSVEESQEESEEHSKSSKNSNNLSNLSAPLSYDSEDFDPKIKRFTNNKLFTTQEIKLEIGKSLDKNIPINFKKTSTENQGDCCQPCKRNNKYLSCIQNN